MSIDLKQTNQECVVQLSNREKQILSLIIQELNNDEIADNLGISKRTVETHRKNIFKKTRAKSVIGLVLLAIRQKLVHV